MARKRATPNFERALEELERLVARLEEGSLSLEESVKTYERGVELTRICQAALDQAEKRIEMLTEKAGGFEPTPFRPNDE